MPSKKSDAAPELSTMLVKEDVASLNAAIDPVCGMKVNPATTAHHATHDGVQYHFCSAGCVPRQHQWHRFDVVI
jgi:YHS domain-containing protein